MSRFPVPPYTPGEGMNRRRLSSIIVICFFVSFTTHPVCGQAPVITSFTPVSGAVGSTVTITGSNFSPTPSANTVFFGAVRGEVTAAAPSSLSVKVPHDAAFAPISVTTNHLTALSNLSFHVTFASNDSLTKTSFVYGPNVKTGTSTNGVIAGDFDGDGNPDLASANSTDNTISVVRNLSTPGNYSFATKVDLTVGHQVLNVGTADFDGDGMLDLAATGSGANTVSLFRNESSAGTIAFDVKSDFPCGTGADQIVTSDLDRDGMIDLLVMDLHSDTVTILRNTSTPGTIAFAPKQNMGTGPNATSIAAGDLDNDGKPDLVVCRGTVVSVFRNISTAGTIAFDVRQDISTGVSMRTVILVDLDGDGRLDLVGLGNVDDAAYVFRNTSSGGTISFGSTQTYPTDPVPYGVAVSDFDGDGIPDLATISEIWNSVTLLHGTSSPGTIAFQAGVSIPASFAPPGITVCDLDGDGRPDISVTSVFNGNIRVLQNAVPVPSPGFQFSQQYILMKGVAVGSNTSDSVIISNPDSMTLSITNVLSSDPEFVVTPTSATITHGSSQTFMVTYTPVLGGVLVDTLSFIYNSVYSPARILAKVNVLPVHPPVISSFSPHKGPVGSSVTLLGTNFDPNPTNDIVYFGPVEGTISSASDTSLIVRVPPGAAYGPIMVTVGGLTASTDVPFICTFVSTNSLDSGSFAPKSDFPVDETPQGLAMGDLDGDGKPDIVTWVENVGINVSIYQNVSNADTVLFNAVSNKVVDNGPYHIVIADIDGDGKLDLITSNGFDGISILLNQSSGGRISFLSPVTFPLNYAGDIAVRDIDLDGRPDLVITKGPIADTMCVLMNISTPGNLAFSPEIDFLTARNPASIAIGDFDGDGKPDIAVSHLYNFIGVFQNTSTPGSVSFAPMIQMYAGNSPSGIAVGDLDGDGKPDIVAANFGNITPSTQYMVLFHNQSSGTSISFSPGQAVQAGSHPNRVAIADVNGDGLPDIAITNDGVNAISVFRNMSTPGRFSLSPPVLYGTGSYPSQPVIEDVNGDGHPDLLSPNYYGQSVSVLENVLPAINIQFQTGWNLVSVGLIQSDNSRTTLFPGCSSQAFAYQGTYVAFDTLVPGSGYWLRFSGASNITMSGKGLYADTIQLVEGWNLVGGISTPIPVHSILSIPGGLVTSQFFGYQGGYTHTDMILPGSGYWVKASQAGQLVFMDQSLSSGIRQSPGASGRIRIVPTEELPPSPPAEGGGVMVPGAFTLRQNYPNPFNPSTTIRYEIPKQCHVTLKVYDLLGREVGMLVDEIEDPGFKSVVFDGSSLASGVYYYRLQAGSFNQSRKLLLVR